MGSDTINFGLYVTVCIFAIYAGIDAFIYITADLWYGRDSLFVKVSTTSIIVAAFGYLYSKLFF